MLLSKRKGPLFMVAASICWSLGGLCIKFIPWNAMSIIGLRSFLAAVVFVIWRKSLSVKFTRGNVLSAVCLALTTILFVFANKLTTAAAAILLQFTAPVFIMLIQMLFYKIKPKLSELVAVSVTVLGMLLFFADRLEPGNLVGNIIAIASGLFFAGVFVCNKRPDTDTRQSLFLGFLINTVVGIPFVFLTAAVNPLAKIFSSNSVLYSVFCEPVTADIYAWIAVIILGVVQVGLAYVFFSLGIKKTSALLACLITALEPVLNPVWVAVFGNEMPGIYAMLGGAVIVITVVCYNIWVERTAKKIKN